MTSVRSSSKAFSTACSSSNARASEADASVWNAAGGPVSNERLGRSGRDAEDAKDSGVEDGDVEAAERVEMEVEEDVRSESDRPSWRSFLFCGCSYGSSSSSSDSSEVSSSSCGQRYPIESDPRTSRRRAKYH